MIYLERIDGVIQAHYVEQAVNFTVGQAECRQGWLGYYRIYSGHKAISGRMGTQYEAWIDAAKKLGWKGDGLG